MVQTVRKIKSYMSSNNTRLTSTYCYLMYMLSKENWVRKKTNLALVLGISTISSMCLKEARKTSVRVSDVHWNKFVEVLFIKHKTVIRVTTDCLVNIFLCNIFCPLRPTTCHVISAVEVRHKQTLFGNYFSFCGTISFG